MALVFRKVFIVRHSAHQFLDGLEQHDEEDCGGADACAPLKECGIAVELRQSVRRVKERGKREWENTPCVSGGCLHLILGDLRWIQKPLGRPEKLRLPMAGIIAVHPVPEFVLY